MKNSSIQNRLLFTLFLCFSFFIGVSAQEINEINIHSDKMDTEIGNIVILPTGYDQSPDKKYPVIYLLHGHGGNQMSFLNMKPELSTLASQNEVIFVCPDGKVSWYWDSPIDPKTQYETYISKELVLYIDTHYRTIANAAGRAITGFSMGGHGSLWMGVNHPDVFGAVGSMSGGVDIRPFPRNWNMLNSLGEYVANKEVWDSHTIATHTDDLRKVSPYIIIDCGQDDFFLTVNEELHKDLLRKKIKHTYISSPGAHNREYWIKAFDWQLAFFLDFFALSK